MKKILLSVLIPAVIFTACSKKKNTGGGAVSALINDSAWTASSSSVTLTKVPTLHISIHADSAQGNIDLELAGYTGPGAYAITGIVSDSVSSASYTGSGRIGSGIVHHARNGEIIVENQYQYGADMTALQGTFHFVADTINVTAGMFNVTVHLD